MADPADTIREALDYCCSDGKGRSWEENNRVALAALTELEQQLAELRADRYGSGVASQEYERRRIAEERAVAAEADRDRLADTLREIAGMERWVQAGPIIDLARAALDRQEAT